MAGNIYQAIPSVIHARRVLVPRAVGPGTYSLPRYRQAF